MSVIRLSFGSLPISTHCLPDPPAPQPEPLRSHLPTISPAAPASSRLFSSAANPGCARLPLTTQTNRSGHQHTATWPAQICRIIRCALPTPRKIPL